LSALANPHSYTRQCPEHRNELVFRPAFRAGAFYAEVPWCSRNGGSHKCDYWFVVDESGEVVAVALAEAKAGAPTYLPLFSEDEMIEHMLSKDEGRKLAQPVSSGAPLSAGFSQIKAIAAWSYKRRQRAEAVA
jgi:hypothetical protein